MFARLVCAVLIAAFSLGQAAAADLPSEEVQTQRKLFGKCSTFNNIWIWGDPRKCPGQGTVPACDAPGVVNAALRFANRAEDVYRVPRVRTFTPVREVPDTYYNPSPLVRRYCVGSVALDNGDHATAYYFVEEDGAVFATSWKVYVCISGYDKWRVYDGRCRVARPAEVN